MIGKGKISEAEVKELQSVYGKGALYKYPFPNGKDDIVFQTIKPELYKTVLSLASSQTATEQDINEKIFDTCVIWPKITLEEKYKFPVGVIPSIVKVIQEKSGLLDVDISGRILAPDVRTTTLRPGIYWGDITENELAELKASSTFQLTRVKVENLVFIIRPMTRSDVRVASQSIDDQVSVAKCVTMWPKDVDWESLPAGYIEHIGKAAIEISGWDSTATCEEL